MPGSKPGFLKAARYGILFLSVALLFFSPWMIKNYLWTNNPIFPLYDHWFNPQDVMNDQMVGLFTYRSSVYHETWWQMALLPVRVFFQGQDGSPQYFDGKLNPFLLLLPAFSFYQIKKDPQPLRNEKMLLLAFAGLFFATAFFSSGMRIRYISPIIPPLVILSILGVRKMVEVVRSLGARYLENTGFAGIFVILICALLLNASYILGQYKYVDPFSYLSGTLSRDQYIDKYRPEYPVLRYINRNLNPHDKILFVFMGNRGYYCDREYVFDMRHNRSMLHNIVMSSSQTKDILKGLKGNGITHMLIRYDIFDRWVKDEDNFTIREQELLGRFFKKHVELLYFKWGYGVSRLEPPCS